VTAVTATIDEGPRLVHQLLTTTTVVEARPFRMSCWADQFVLDCTAPRLQLVDETADGAGSVLGFPSGSRIPKKIYNIFL
jgi:hypothetical protein